MATTKLPPHIDALLAARKDHFDQRIESLVATALAAHHEDETAAKVAAEVEARTRPLMQSLVQQQSRIEGLVADLEQMEATTVVPLRAERDGLADENRALKAELASVEQSDHRRVADAEATTQAAREAQEAAAEHLRVVTAQLKDALSECTRLTASVENLSHANITLEAALSEAAAQRERDVQAAVASVTNHFSVQLNACSEIVSERDTLSVKLSEAATELQASLQSNDELRVEVTDLKMALQTMNERLEAVTAAAQREAAAASNKAVDATALLATRGELLEFWRSGHARIHEMERKLEAASRTESEQLVVAAAARDAASHRSRLIASITALSAQVEALQEEKEQLGRSLYAAEHEAETLQRHLCVALQGHMTADELQHCAAFIREAHLSVASGQSMQAADPAVAKQLQHQLQSMQHELQGLETKKLQLASDIQKQNETLSSLAVTASTMRAQKTGLSADAVAQMTAILRSTGVEEDKVKRLDDLRRLQDTMQRLASVTADLQRVSLERDAAVKELSDERDAARCNASRLESNLNSCRDRLRTATHERAAMAQRLAIINQMAEQRRDAITACVSVVKTLAEVLPSCVTDVAALRSALSESRAESLRLQRHQQAAIDDALQKYDDDAICGQLQQHQVVMERELRRRQRADEIHCAADRTELATELLQRTEALARVAERAKELGETAAQSQAGRAESEEWCSTVAAALSALQQDVAEAKRLAARQGFAVGRDFSAAIAAAFGAGRVATVTAANGVAATAQSSRLVPPVPVDEPSPVDDDDDDGSGSIFGGSVFGTSAALMEQEVHKVLDAVEKVSRGIAADEGGAAS